MKCLSLWQPWATLIALGAKQYETRSWGTAYRGPLVIHAAKTKEALDICHEYPFRNVLLSSGIKRLSELPFGAALCVVDLVDCLPMTADLIDVMTTQEQFFGDWKPGRFAWKLANLRPFKQPIPMRGIQGLFNSPIAIPAE